MYRIGREELSALAKLIESGRLFRYQEGSQTELLEQEWAKKIGARHCLATTSGTASLICGLAGMGIGPGDEVIIPGYTFIATAAAVLAVGAIPVLAEIDETLTLDAGDVARKISPYTKAVIPVHMQGMPCDMDAIAKVARRHGLKILEDACQADGGSYKGRRLGSMGDAGANSFNFYKIIGAGEGGALSTNDNEIYEKAIIHHDCGNTFFSKRPISVPLFMGGNYRMSELLAAVLRVQVRRLDGLLKKLRAEKTILKNALKDETAFRTSPSNDESGDCGTTLSLLFPDAVSAASFVDSARSGGIEGAHSPINTGKHVYSNWQAVMEKNGAHHPDRNPYKYARRKIAYTKGMLPRTLDILARTVYVPLHVDHTAAARRQILKTIRGAS